MQIRTLDNLILALPVPSSSVYLLGGALFKRMLVTLWCFLTIKRGEKGKHVHHKDVTKIPSPRGISPSEGPEGDMS